MFKDFFRSYKITRNMMPSGQKAKPWRLLPPRFCFWIKMKKIIAYGGLGAKPPGFWFLLEGHHMPGGDRMVTP